MAAEGNSETAAAARALLANERWSDVRRALKEAEDSDDAWWDKNEIREAIVRANAMDIEPSLVLACYQACTSLVASRRRGVERGRAGKRRVLVVDDEEAIREGLKLNLEATRRFEVRTEGDPAHAIDAAADFEPDVLLLDVVMPAKNGLELLGEIRAHEALCDTPAIMVTALADRLDTSGVASEGVLYLSKPTSTKKLIYCIEELAKARGWAAA